MSWLHTRTHELLAQADEARAAGVFPFFRPFENIGPQVRIGDRDYVNFTSNDYLGLSQDEDVKRAAIEGVRRFGTGLGSSRLQATSVRHEELEERLASWLGFESCVIFPSGYQALIGVLSAFLGDSTLVALDNQSHASILDGVYLAKGTCPDLEERFFRHNSVRGLRRILARSQRPEKLVVVEGLYGADGDTAPLGEMVAICRELGVPLVVDDAHGVGALGEHGRGSAEHHGVLADVDVLIGTFSKVFGGVGGFACGDRELMEFVKLSARSFVFSASLPVGQIEGALAALERVEGDPALRERLRRNERFLRAGLKELGCDLGQSEAHVCPIMVGDEEQAMALGAALYEKGIIMLPFIYPGVPLGEARLRCNVTAAHEETDLVRALEVVAAVGPALGLFADSRVSGGAS